MLTFFRRFLRKDDGAVAVEFAFVFPALFLITMGTLDLALMMSDIHLGSAAAQNAARQAVIEDQLVNLTVDGSDDVVCVGSGTGADAANIGYSCSDGTTGTNLTGFYAIFQAAKIHLGTITPSDLTVTYHPSELDDAALLENVTTPTVTVSISNLSYRPMSLGVIPGFPDEFPLPNAHSDRMAPSNIQST